MDGGQSVELNEWLIVVGETTKLVAWGWKVSFVDAFVYQLRRRMFIAHFAMQFAVFYSLMSIYLRVNYEC